MAYIAPVRLAYGDVPQQLKKQYPSNRKFNVRVQSNAQIPTNMWDWNVRHITLHSNGRAETLTDCGYENAINEPPYLFFGKEGRPFKDGEYIVIQNSYPKCVDILCNSATARKLFGIKEMLPNG